MRKRRMTVEESITRTLRGIIFTYAKMNRPYTRRGIVSTDAKRNHLYIYIREEGSFLRTRRRFVFQSRTTLAAHFLQTVAARLAASKQHVGATAALHGAVDAARG